MGVVYAARDEQLGRSVSIKMIKAAAVHAPGARERMFREARAAASLNHRATSISRRGLSGNPIFLDPGTAHRNERRSNVGRA